MPKRIVKSPVMIVRAGKLVYPEVGKPFDFTDAEMVSVSKANPKALEKIILADAPVVAVRPVIATDAPRKG